MRASATFTVESFTPTDVTPEPPIATALPIGVARMEKRFSGEIEGRAATLFTSAYGESSGGTYLAMEAFEGTVAGREGSCAFVHSATTTGSDRLHEFFLIVPGSGTGELAGISGGGGMAIDADGTHRIWFDCEFDA